MLISLIQFNCFKMDDICISVVTYSLNIISRKGRKDAKSLIHFLCVSAS